MMKKTVVVILLFTLCQHGFAEVSPKKRNYFWPPLLSFVLPGFDQWKQKEFVSAASYSGVAAAGIGLNIAYYNASTGDVVDKDDRARLYLLGAQMYQMMGSLSLLQCFKGIINDREDFAFAKNGETMGDVAMAPIRMDFLLRPTTFIPLLLGGALFVLDANDHTRHHVSINSKDVFFATAFSYGAGVGEEAVFRGWLMPVSNRWFGSPFWSNTFQAGLFAAAHLGSVKIPWPQFLMGWYLGILAQQRDWTISESIFIHTWWDVLAFLAEYSYRGKTDPPAVLRLPQITLRF